MLFYHFLLHNMPSFNKNIYIVVYEFHVRRFIGINYINNYCFGERVFMVVSSLLVLLAFTKRLICVFVLDLLWCLGVWIKMEIIFCTLQITFDILFFLLFAPNFNRWKLKLSECYRIFQKIDLILLLLFTHCLLDFR